MKALELSDLALTEWSRKEHSDPQVMLNKCAIELRRLAEVNAALLKAINELSVTAESTKPGEFSVASHALFALHAAANKAKEQQ